MEKPISSAHIRQIFVILLILALCAAILWELLPYLTGILGAITIYVLFRKWMQRLVKKGWNKNLAAIALMLVSLIGILIPVSGIALMLGNKITKTLENSDEMVSTLKGQLGTWEDSLGFNLTSQLDAENLSGWLTEHLKNAVGGTFSMLISLGIMYFLLYYMFTLQGDLKSFVSRFVPMGKEGFDQVSKKINASVRSNALGIPLVAIAQGVIALIGFFIFGIEKPFFWFVIVTIGSMVPFVGTFIGILPVFIIAMMAGDTVQAWGILIYGIVVVGSTDNIIRLYVLKKLDDVHPLITLIGVIVGVPLFGFIGLIFGPLLVSLTLTLIQIYNRDSSKDSEIG